MVAGMNKLHPAAAQLLAEIEAYCKLTSTDRTAFGIEAVNDGHFIARMEDGRIPKIPTMDRVRAFMAKKTKAVRK
jgi:hypothetical protein